MKIGIFSVADHYRNELPRTVERFYGELLEQAEAADALGFDSFWVAEHHFQLLVEKDLIAFGGPADIVRIAQRYESLGAHAPASDRELRRARPRARAALDGADGEARPACRRSSRGRT